MTTWEKYHSINGPIVIVGFGSIGRGALPLILRHFDVDPARVTIFDPKDSNRRYADEAGVRFIQQAVTDENHEALLLPLLTAGPEQGFLLHMAVDVSSLAMMKLARKANALYMDMVIEPWPGFYDSEVDDLAERSNYVLRENLLAFRRANPGGPTAVSCCGANPGMVSWMTKQALINLCDDLKIEYTQPQTREEWAALMRKAGVKGVHIAERDTQKAATPKSDNAFVNTWSVDGFIAEGLQPAELGWGTHEKALPALGRTHKGGAGSAIYLDIMGAATRVRTWTPTTGAQHGFLITHNESISISDYFTVRDNGKVAFRPTCHYAYHPCDDAVTSWEEMQANNWERQPETVLLQEHEIVSGMDELGVLLYGHAKNAYWYGSQLSIAQTRKLAPYQNATGLQVSSALIAAMAWALENPDKGIVEVDETDYRRCLDIQKQYLGTVAGVYTDWTPLQDRNARPDAMDKSDPWQFSNVFVNDQVSDEPMTDMPLRKAA